MVTLADSTLPVHPAALYSASISPDMVRTSQTTTYTLTITNIPGSTVHLGSANLTVYGSFTSVSLGSVTAPPGKLWTADLVSGVIQLSGAGHTSELVAGESVRLAITATAPDVPGPTFWGTQAWNGTDFSGSPFSLSGGGLVVTVLLNHAPTATVSLSPYNPSTNETLTANATGTDMDGDPVSLSSVWKVNGIVLAGETGSTLDLSLPGHGDPDDIVTVEVTPNDSYINGATITAGVTVVNLYRVSGFVRTIRGLPMPDVSITLTGQFAPATTNSNTNSNGYYSFSGVKPGPYDLTPTKTGYTFTPATISLVVNTTSRVVNFVGMPVIPVYNISGRVSTPTGAPIPNVSISITPTPAGVTTPVPTNSAGYYTLYDVPDGSYTIIPTRPGLSFTPASRTVSVSGASLTGINFVGSSGYIISGRVSTSTGAPLAHVSLNINPALNVTTPVFSNSAGYYTFRYVPNGSYTITPTMVGLSFSPVSRAATVSGTSISGLNFIGRPVIPVYNISGRVSTTRGTPIANVSVALSPAAPSVKTPVLTNSAGYYTFTQVPDGGNHTITPGKADMSFSPQTRAVTVSGASVSGQNFVGSTAYIVSGRVATSSGAPVPGVTLLLDNGPGAITNSAGYYTFYDVANGDHTVTPVRTGMTFIPPSRTVMVSSASVSGQNFIASGP